MQRRIPDLTAPILVCTLLVLITFSAPPTAHADGGAPNLAYVAGTGKGISVIDVAQQKISSTIPVEGDPHTIALSLDGRFLYVTQPRLNRVAIIAARNGELVCTANVAGQPSVLAFDNSLNTLFAAGSGGATVSAIDPTNCKIKRTFQANGAVYGLAVAAVGSALSGETGNQLWIADNSSLSIFDDLKGNKIGSVTIPGGPEHITIPAGATVYVTTRQGSVLAVDLNTRKMETLIKGGQYGPMDYDAITGEIYVPDQQHKKLMVLAPVSAGFPSPHQPSRTIDLEVEPESIAITSDGQLGFVALKGGNVVMLDIPGRQTINTFFVGGNPKFIITGLYPPVIGTTPEQASTLGTIINIAAYIFVISLLIVPIVLFRRYTKARAASGLDKQDE